MCNALILVTKEALETVEIFRNQKSISFESNKASGIRTHMFKQVSIKKVCNVQINWLV